MGNFDLGTKPDPQTCPRKFCFHWARTGDRVDESGREYDSFDEAIARAKTVVTSARCACIFRTCSRSRADAGQQDRYEPAEDFLREAGLPWFFFVAGKDCLAKEFWEDYDRETRKLWGDPASD